MRKIRFVTLILPALLACSVVKADVSPLEKLLLDKQYPAFTREAELSAQQGNAEALFLLGKTHHLGWGVEVDLDKAEKFYWLAAKKDSARAWHNLGKIELDRNRPAEAIRYLEKALELGLKTPTLFNLGRANLILGKYAQHIPTLQKALNYLQQSYASNPDDYTLGEIITASTMAYRLSDYQPSSEKAPEQHAEAMKWLELGISRDLGMAFANRGALLYYEGKVAEAIPWFEKAVEKKVREAAYGLGLVYKNGEGGIAKDTNKALYWFEIAAKQDMEEARYEAIHIREDRLRDTSRMTTPELAAAIEALAAYQEVSVILPEARRQLEQRHAFEQNRQIPKPLPAGKLQFSPCLTTDGLPEINTHWRIVALENPTDEPIVQKGLIEGKTDMQGCIRITPQEAGKLKQALADGKLLAWVAYSRANLLKLREPIRPGLLVLIFSE